MTSRKSSIDRKQPPEILTAVDAFGEIGNEIGDRSAVNEFTETQAAISASIRANQREGASLTHCVLCTGKIARARQQAIKGVQTCITCARKEENGTASAMASGDVNGLGDLMPQRSPHAVTPDELRTSLNR